MRTLILLLLAGCAACSSGAAPQASSSPSPKAPPAQGSDTLARIRAMVGTPACSSDAECHTLALGHKSCGGPESYLAWSSGKTSQAALEALNERYKEERRAADAASGMVSNCRFMPDPGAVCRAGTCQLGEGGSAGASAR